MEEVVEGKDEAGANEVAEVVVWVSTLLTVVAPCPEAGRTGADCPVLTGAVVELLVTVVAAGAELVIGAEVGTVVGPWLDFENREPPCPWLAV